MKTIKIFGRQVSLLFFAFAIFAFAASATMLTYYGRFVTTANVKQSVLVDGESYTHGDITQTLDVTGGSESCSVHYLKNQAEIPAPVTFNTWYSPNGQGITTSINTDCEDDNRDFGSSDNEAFSFTVDATLDQLFDGEGLTLNYDVIEGGLHNGAAPVMVVIDLYDGRHVILYAGWGDRTGSEKLQYSDTVSLATSDGGDRVVDFTIYDNAWIRTFSSSPGYPGFDGVKSMSGLTGLEKAVRVAVAHQAAASGQVDRVTSITIKGTEYSIPAITLGAPVTLYPGQHLNFNLCHTFDLKIWPGEYVIVTSVE